VLSLAISLALTVLSTALPTSSPATDATVEVCFAPEDDCAAFAVRAIEAAGREILVSAYRLTVGSGVVGALIRAKERGVDVQVIADRGAPCGRASGIEPLLAPTVRMAHTKIMVIDGVAHCTAPRVGPAERTSRIST
jgi:phosphatidylserine/phosphatidylglycerophosphate/cardiolipin synthase-like enzyme